MVDLGDADDADFADERRSYMDALITDSISSHFQNLMPNGCHK